MLSLSITVFAQQLSVEQAKSHALAKLKTLRTQKSLKTSQLSSLTPDLSLAYTATAGDKNQFYVFNATDGGFVVAGADEVAEPVLAYSETGSFDINTANPNLRYWLSMYQKEISAAIAAPTSSLLPATSSLRAKLAKKDVAILVPTRWDQSSPYNDSIRAYTGKNYLTGCVATSMSQVMKTNRWPLSGKGSHTYTDTGYSGKTYTRNFSHSYDWDNMLNTYSSSATDVQKGAVATLMFDAGVSVEMMYDTSARGGSGAYTEDVAYAFVNFFGYDAGVRHCYRDYYTLNEWADIVYSDLAAGHPIMYGGSDPDAGGHSFICDGYKASDDTYHFNWGWSGEQDCYAKLSAVKCLSYNWKSYQDIVCCIQAPVEGSKAVPSVILDEEYDLTITESTSGGLPSFTCKCGTYTYNYETYQGEFLNDTWKDFNYEFAMMYVNQSTGDTYIAKSANPADNTVSFPLNYPLRSNRYGTSHKSITSITVKNVVLPAMAAGTYNVYLAFRDADDSESAWDKVRGHNTKTYWLTTTVTPRVAAPVAREATDITSSGFTANWTAVPEADSYTLSLTATEAGAGSVDLLSEDFSGFSGYTSDGTTDLSGKLDQYMQLPGWTGSKIYASPSRIKMGSSSAGGSLTSPSLSAQGRVRVVISEDLYGSDTPVITVKVGEITNTFTASGTTHTFDVDVDGNFQVALSADGSKQRIYINNISVIGNAGTTSVQTFEGITDNRLSLSGLDNAYTYVYKVKAVSSEGVSYWSDDVSVSLPADTVPPTPLDTCASPVVAYADGVLSITSDTEGATCFYTLTDDDVCPLFTAVSDDIALCATYVIRAYAQCEGMVPSDTVQAVLCWVEGQLNPGTAIIEVPSTPVVVQYAGGSLSVDGLQDDVEVKVYSLGGTCLATGRCVDGRALIPLSTQRGDILIIKLGRNAIKFKI